MRPRDLGIGHLFERVRDAIIVADVHTGRIVLWNPAATEIFGYSVSEALKMDVEELVPERLRERHRAGLARYRETGHGPYIDSRELLDLPALRKSGGEIRIEMSLSTIEPVRDVGDGERRYALAVVRDITERKTTEEALRESEERFHALVQNSLDIVMVTDAQGTIRYVSPSVERVLGYRSQEMVGTSTAEYVHPEDLERALRELAEAASKPGVHPVAVDTRVRHKDGSWRHLEGIANNLLDDPVVGAWCSTTGTSPNASESRPCEYREGDTLGRRRDYGQACPLGGGSQHGEAAAEHLSSLRRRPQDVNKKRAYPQSLRPGKLSKSVYDRSRRCPRRTLPCHV